MKNYFRHLFVIILLSQVICGRIHADDKELALKYLASSELSEINMGLKFAGYINTSEINERLVSMLDNDMEGYIDGDLIYVAPRKGALFFLQRRFLEYSEDSNRKPLTDEEAAAFKKWWALNKNNIIYHDNNTHSYSKSKIEAEQVVPPNGP